MIIAVDFDGTCVKHRYPYIGESIGAECVLKTLTDNGHRLILYTMRSHPIKGAFDEKLLKQDLVPTNKDTLQDAIEWFRQLDIPLYSVNENPQQHSWTQSKKCYANVYIDDAALGVPLTQDNEGNIFVDWRVIVEFLHEMGCLTSRQMDDLKSIIEKVLSL